MLDVGTLTCHGQQSLNDLLALQQQFCSGGLAALSTSSLLLKQSLFLSRENAEASLGNVSDSPYPYLLVCSFPGEMKTMRGCGFTVSTEISMNLA